MRERLSQWFVAITLGMHSHAGHAHHDEPAETIAGLVLANAVGDKAPFEACRMDACRNLAMHLRIN